MSPIPAREGAETRLAPRIRYHEVMLFHRPRITMLVGILGLCLAGGLLRTGGVFANAESVRMVFVGDTGSGSDRQRAVAAGIQRLAAAGGLDAVVLLGDNIYGRNKAALFQDRFLDVYSRLFSLGVPFHAALGNHDVERCRVADAEELPRDASAYQEGDSCWAHEQMAIPRFGYRDGHRYYSFASAGDRPLVETFVLDSNTLLADGGADDEEGGAEGGGWDEAQVEWLETALRQSNATWKVLAMHHPVHSPKGRRILGWGHEAESDLLDRLEDIIVGQVDVVFQGHNHLYARMHPRRGVRYFVSGGGGKKPYRFVPDDDTVPRPRDHGRFNHFVLVEATRERMKYCVIDRAGALRDSGWFAKGDPADSPLPAQACPAG